MEKTLIVTIKLKSEKDSWRLEDIVEEMEQLTRTAGAEVVDNITCVLEKPTPNFFIGSGKAEEIAHLCEDSGIDTVIFSRDLSGTQQRNLEEAIGKKTIDRTQLILDIFARHAKSPVGKTQVELAQLQYLLPRLTGKGILMTRLGGGIGTSGPGEQKLEVDRRRIRKRIDRLRADLNSAARHRLTLKKRRKDNAVPAVALVGYTSAGKSTLINALTEARQDVAESLFTTLDPLSKSISLPNGERTVILDTVGFLYGLPHHLIEAFKATLEEVVDADLLVNVLDVNHSRAHEHNQAVLDVLRQIGAQDKPMIVALNKIDLLDDQMWLERMKADFSGAVAISAKTKQNLGLLLERVQEAFAGRMIKARILMPHTRMDLVGLFYREGRVEKVEFLQQGIRVEVNLPKLLYSKLLSEKDIEVS